MREAFDALAAAVDELYETEVSRYGDPWRLRNEAIELYKCGLPLTDEERYASTGSRSLRSGSAASRTHPRACSRRSSRCSACACSCTPSCAWFFSDVSGVEARQMLSYALRAAEIAEEVSGRKDYVAPLMENLKKAKGNTKDYPDAASVVTKCVAPHAQLEELAAGGRRNG